LKILLIITPFHPSQTPNTMRWIPIMKYYAKQGIETTVLTTKNRSIGSKNDLKDYQVYNVGYNTLLDWFYFTFKIKKRRQIPNRNSGVDRPKSGNKLLQKFIDLTWRKFYWPDGSMLFYQPGIKEAIKIVSYDKDITHIVSVGLPFTCHLIASQLKEKYPHLYWHQDIEDPFSYSEEFWVNNFKKYQQNNTDAERKVFELSDSISVTNSRAKQKYETLFHESAHKLSVIHPMFSDYENNISLDLALDNDKIHIGYFGSFYEKVRSPEPLLDFLDYVREHDIDKIEQWHFHFFGQQSRFSIPIFEAYAELKPYIRLHGFYDRDISISAMRQMNVLLNVGNSTDYHLPSKVVDYLYINKPLINIKSIDTDATALFLDNRVDICNLLLQEDNYKALSKTFFAFIDNAKMNTEVSESNIAAYTTEVIGQKYLQAMQVDQELL